MSSFEAEVAIALDETCSDLGLPQPATAGSAGLDLRAAVDGEWVLAPGERRDVPTGIRIAVPNGFEAQVRPRSGLALRHGLALVNSPGTIDSDYRGEIRVIVINLGQAPIPIRRGDRIAQLVVAPVASVRWRAAATLPPTARAEGGFGSTGHS